MKRSYPLMLVFLLVALFQYGSAQELSMTPLLEAPDDVRASKAFQRELWFYSQRAWPDVRIPVDAVERVAELRHITPFRKPNSTRYSYSPWRPIGPSPGRYGTWGNISSRIPAIAVDPNHPGRLYIGAANGGVWRSDDDGAHWTPLTDHEVSTAMGAVAVDSDNSDIIYAATGEATYSGSSYSGMGILKSTDGGQSWTWLRNGLPLGAVISRIRIRPSNHDEIITAHGNSGIYLSTDAGESWRRVYGARTDDIFYHPLDDSILIASGPGGIIRSTDAGRTWRKFGTGVPAAKRTHVDVCRQQPDVLYASTYGEPKGAKVKVYKSIDGGVTWVQKGDSVNFKGNQAWYDFYIRVHPVNPDIAFVGTIEIFRTKDGGDTWKEISRGYSGGPVHVDQHFLEFHPVKPNTIYVSNDGGIYASSNLGDSWRNLNRGLTLTQFYRIAADPQDPDHVLGGTQDNGTQQTYGDVTWGAAFGGDGGEVAFSRGDSKLILGETQNGGLMRSTDGGFIWKAARSGFTKGERAAWVAPIIPSPAGGSKFYHGRVSLYVTNNAGQLWKNVADSVFGKNVITQIAVSGDEAFWYVVNNRTVKLSVDEGQTWTLISQGLPNRTITSIYTHPDSGKVVFVTLSGFGGEKVWRTGYKGTGWFSVSGNLPEVPANDIVLDPDDPDRHWYVATDVGVFVTENAGETWAELSTGLPNTVVQHLDYNKNGKLLRAGTHGRGVWEMAVLVRRVLPPGNPVARAETRRAVVSWDPSPTPGVVNYSVYRGTKTGLGRHVANVGTSTAFINDGLENDVTYYYRIRAVTWDDSSEFTPEVSATPYIWQGCLGNVVALDGRNAHVVVPKVVNFLDSITVEGWVWWKSFLSWSRFVDFGTRDRAFLVANDGSSNTLVFDVYDSLGRSHRIRAARILDVEKPVHIAASAGPAGMRLYVNGRLIDTYPYKGATRAAGVKKPTNYIGRSNWSTDRRFRGEIDEFRVWAYQRSDEEIARDWNRTLTPEERRDPRLLVYYDFEKIDDDKVLDQSTTGAHGTLKNGAAITVCSTPADVPADRIRPIRFSLEQNYPNPFNPVTELTFSVEKSRTISLEVYALNGTRAATLISDELYHPGRYTVRFDGSAMPTGVYIAILSSGNERIVRKMMLVK